MLRKRSEKKGKSFDFIVSSRFYKKIGELELLGIPISDRKFTWSRSVSSDSFALLDRFFCSLTWNEHFSNHNVFSLPRVQIIILSFYSTTPLNKVLNYQLDLKRIGYSKRGS